MTPILICGDSLTMNLAGFHCAIADPPDNLGLKYGAYHDRLPAAEYKEFLTRTVRALIAATAPSPEGFRGGVAWLSHHSKHTSLVWNILGSCAAHLDIRTIIWRFTFGQYRESDMGYGYRPIVRICSPWTQLRPQREQSARSRIGDKRVTDHSRVHDDVWDFPRVVGNSGERRSWHPTQHPVAIYDRMIKWSPLADDGTRRAVDLFAGSGTIFRAGRLNPTTHITGIEVDPDYCQRMRNEHDLEIKCTTVH